MLEVVRSDIAAVLLAKNGDISIRCHSKGQGCHDCAHGECNCPLTAESLAARRKLRGGTHSVLAQLLCALA